MRRERKNNVYDLGSVTSNSRRNFHKGSQDGSLVRMLAEAAALEQDPVQAETCATTQETDAVPESTSNPFSHTHSE